MGLDNKSRHTIFHIIFVHVATYLYMCLHIVSNELKATREMKRNWNNFIKFVEIVHYNHFVINGGRQ